MPYFDLDIKVAKPGDIFGHFLFPKDKHKATLFAVRDLVKFYGAFDKFRDHSKKPSKAQKQIINNDWASFRSELERYGGLVMLETLLADRYYHQEEQQAFVEGILVGLALIKAVQLDHSIFKVSRTAAFKLVENYINKMEQMDGFKDHLGQKIYFKKVRTRLYDCWNNRSCVAHWWAAIVTWQLQHDVDDLESNLMILANYPKLAAISNAFLDAGSSIMIRKEKKKMQPFLIPDEAFQLPEGLGKAAETFYLPLLSDWEVNLLKPKK